MNFIFGACYIVMKLLVNSLSLELEKGSNETNLTICEFFHSVFNLECSFTKALFYNDEEEEQDEPGIKTLIGPILTSN
jgi:hypothetical protein